MTLLAFGCEARVGKDTAVDYLIGKKGGVKKSFAAPLYDIQHYTHTRLGLKIKKDREFLQLVGDWGRKQNEHIFINVLLREIDTDCVTNDSVTDCVTNDSVTDCVTNDSVTDCVTNDSVSKTENVYVSDVRYPNEFFVLKNRGFTMVRLTRDNRFVSTDTNVTSHSSENSLQDYPWDIIISNNGSLVDLYAQLDQLYSNSKD